MDYRSSDTALIIANYGTPRSAAIKDVRKFLRQLLGNRHVMTIGALKRWFLVNCIIVPARAKKSAAMYAKLQDKRGMPLLYHTQDLVKKVRLLLGKKADVYYAMTSGSMLVKNIVNKVVSAGYSRIVVMPMFPQYAESTTANIIDEVLNTLRNRRFIPPVSFIPAFYNNDYYIRCMQRLLQDNLRDFNYEKIVFSYHGVPWKHNDIGNPSYNTQCFATTRFICSAAGIPHEMTVTSFQSRMHEDWIQPFTDTVVRQLAKDGVKNIAVVTPSFTVDCLETVVEISQTLRDVFLSEGGEQFLAIPCLNAEDYWAEAVVQIAMQSLL